MRRRRRGGRWRLDGGGGGDDNCKYRCSNKNDYRIYKSSGNCYKKWCDGKCWDGNKKEISWKYCKSDGGDGGDGSSSDCKKWKKKYDKCKKNKKKKMSNKKAKKEVSMSITIFIFVYLFDNLRVNRVLLLTFVRFLHHLLFHKTQCKKKGYYKKYDKHC